MLSRIGLAQHGKDLGKIAAVKKTGAASDILFDQIVVRLSEADAQKLPAAQNTQK